MKKFFSFRVAALVSVSVFLFGCETEVEVPVPVPGPSTVIVCDVVARNLTQLKAYLQDNTSSVIGLEGEIYLTGSLTIPSGKTLYIVGGYLDTNSKSLIINGAVYVGYGAALEETGYSNMYIMGGSITVLYGGVLSLLSESIRYSYSDLSTVLGTNTVTIDGGNLIIEKLQNKAAIEKVFPSVKKGRLIVRKLTDVSWIKPSDIVGITSISENKMLIISLIGAKPETEESLTIPEGLMLTINQDFANVETLEINGGLVIKADVSISGEKTLTVNGELVVGPTSTLTVENDVEISGVLTLEKGAKLVTTETGTVKFGETTFSGTGVWTAGATGDNTNDTSLSIISGGTEAAVIFNGNASQAGTLTATSGNPVITQAAGQNNAFYIYNYVTINLGTIGQITLESGPKPGLLAFSDDTSIVLMGENTDTTSKDYSNQTKLVIGNNVYVSYMTVSKKTSGNTLTKLSGYDPSKWGLIYASETPDKDVEINSTAVVATGS